MVLNPVETKTSISLTSTYSKRGFGEGDIVRARKIFEFHLARWASNPQILLARGTSPFARLFKLINNL